MRSLIIYRQYVYIYTNYYKMVEAAGIEPASVNPSA